jgi:hypothetical protein
MVSRLDAQGRGRFTLLRWLHYQIVRQLEMHNRFRRYIDVPVAGQARNGGSCAAASQAANKQACPSRG